MKTRGVILLFVIILAMTGKFYSAKSFQAHRTTRPNLKPVEASYTARALKKYAFGFDNMIAALIWVQTLQFAEHTPVKGDEVTWEFAQIDGITELDPNFSSAYSYGAIFLSYLRRDKLGGRILLEKWARRYPTYWRPTHMLGMHYYEELGDYQSAAPLIVRASQMENAPLWLGALGVRLLSESGTLINAITSAIELAKLATNNVSFSYLAERIRVLNFNIQKRHWQTAVDKYKSRYRKPPPNLEAAAQFSEELPREVSSLAISDIPEEIQKALKERFAFKFDKDGSVVATDASLEATLSRMGVHRDKMAAPRVK